MTRIFTLNWDAEPPGDVVVEVERKSLGEIVITVKSMNSRLLVRAESRLRSLIDASVRSLPFPLMDRYELWAMDAQQKPVALLSSCCHPSQFDANETHRWQACRLTDYDFSPQDIEPEVPRDAANRLEHHVNRIIVVRTWFKRDQAGCGSAIADRTQTLCEPDEFPSMLVREEWDSEEMRVLVSAWIHWKSAALLTLSCLDRPQREQLEKAASRHPFNVKRHHRLYPEVLDADSLRTTLVKARLLLSSNAAAS